MMNYHDPDHGCERVGRWMAVMCAALGVATGYLMVAVLSRGFIVPTFPPPKEITVALITLFLAAAFLGERAGVRLCGKGDNAPLNVLVGQGVAFGSITIAVMFATLLVIISGRPFQSGDVTPLRLVLVLFAPLGFVLLFGGIPAILLGVLYGFLVRNRLRKLNQDA